MSQHFPTVDYLVRVFRSAHFNERLADIYRTDLSPSICQNPRNPALAASRVQDLKPLNIIHHFEEDGQDRVSVNIHARYNG